MFTSGINFLAVAASAIVAYAAGFLWFTVLFRAPYLEGLGKTAEQLGRGPSMLVASIYQLIGDLVMACVFAWLMVQTGMRSMPQGLLLAFLIWLGFIAAFLGPTFAFQAFSLPFFLIISGSALLSLLIMAVILGGWQ